MIYRTRDNSEIRGNDGQDRFISFLYGHLPGRMLVKCLVHPWVSALFGVFLSSSPSRVLIRSFIRKAGIDMKQYEDRSYRSYNDFFTRRIREGQRPIDNEPAHFISPCDAKLTVFPIQADGNFFIKHTCYTAESLLKNRKLARRYEGGTAFIFRLTVDDYHRYCYVDKGKKSRNIRLPGILHTVNPAANDVYPIYKENSREYCLLKSENFGTLMVMEVGALVVGKIVNEHEEAFVERGQEKGHFAFGGSTIILFAEPGRVVIDDDIARNSAEHVETIVKMGEKIGMGQVCPQ